MKKFIAATCYLIVVAFIFVAPVLATDAVQRSDIARGDFLKVDYGDGNWDTYWVLNNDGDGKVVLRDNTCGYASYDWTALLKNYLTVYKWGTPEWHSVAEQYLR